jgi:hypothetical protein
MPGRRAAPFDFSLTVHLNEEPEGEPEQNGDVGVRYVSTGFFQPRGETGFDRRLYRARRPKGDTPNL